MRSTMHRPALFVASVVAGLVGMLVVDGAMDMLFLASAAAPLVVGGWCWWRRRPARATSR